jgi:Fic family protein
LDIKNFNSGTWRKGFKYEYFLPEPVNYTFYWTDTKINTQLEKASMKLGELNSFARLVPDVNMFIRTHVLKEAVVSSRIEGTRTEMEDALRNKTDITPEKRDDWQEVNNYVEAMNSAIEELQKLPLSNRLLRNAHKLLLDNVRGGYKNPGEFRTSQNWIGGATITDAVYIPPAHTGVPDLMADLEKFLHNEDIAVPHLVKIAIAHYQFESIHPFLDGNGRIGRLMITLYLVSKGILDKPLLYLSNFLKNTETFTMTISAVSARKTIYGNGFSFFWSLLKKPPLKRQ